MHGTNPYAQAGWFNPANPNTINTQPWGISAISGPSIFGALPLPSSQTSLPTLLTFHYVCLNPDVLNCMVTGPTSIPYLEISTSGTQTVFRRTDQQGIATIDWSQGHTTLSMGSMVQQPISNWLRLSVDGNHRRMTINGRAFMWALADNNCYCLYAFGEITKGPLARIYQTHQTITLELTTEAFHLGALEAAIVAVVLFKSGRSLD